MPLVTVGDAALYYQEYGAGDPLVLAHGFTSVGEGWADVLPALTEHYRVIVPDLRGHGRSTGAPATIRVDRFGTDLAALLDHLGLERAHLVGHSGGGPGVLGLATPQPDRVPALTSVGATHTRGQPMRPRMRDLAATVEAD